MKTIEQLIIKKLDSLTPKLYDLGNKLYFKFGTESYEERCIISDIRDELISCIEMIKIDQLSTSLELASLKEQMEKEKEKLI